MTIVPRHEVIRAAIELAGSSLVSIYFYKKDGSERQLTFNPKDFNEIKGTGKPCTDPNIFRIRESRNKENEGKPAWRSFDARRVYKLKFAGIEMVFEPEMIPPVPALETTSL